MTVLITLSGIGNNAGPTFNLYSSIDGTTFTSIAPGINKTALEIGYQATVPDGTTNIKVTSIGDCTNSEVATISVIPTTTNNAFINFSTFTTVPDSPWFNQPNPYTEMDFNTETLIARYGIVTNPPFGGNLAGTLVFSLGTQFNLSNVAFNLLIYKNGTLINTIQSTTTTTINPIEVLRITEIAADSTWLGNYQYKIESSSSLTFSNCQLRTILYYTTEDITLEYYQSRYNQTVSQSLN